MAAIMFLVFIGLLLIEMPVPIAIGVASVYGIITGNLSLQLTASIVLKTLNSFTLISVPFFILAGSIMSRGSIAKKLLNVCKTFNSKNKFGMGITTIIASAFFAALSGSAVATVAAIGAITIPMMIKLGYKPSFATAIAASGAIVGPIIPPSIIMVVYGVQTNTSISDLFLAGFIPGILLSIGFVITTKLTHKGKIDEEKALVKAEESLSVKEKILVVWDAKWALMMPVIVLGGIYAGIVTPTEASVIACDYAIIVSMLIERDMKWKDLREAFIASIKTLGGLLILLGMAGTFGYVITLNQIPDKLCGLVLDLTSNKILILLIVNLILLLAGCFLEACAAIVIFAPIMLPLINQVGISTLAFGVIMCVNLVIGTLTPPFGLNLYVGSSVSKVPVHEIAKQALPFILAAITVLILITYCPQIIEFLPNIF